MSPIKKRQGANLPHWTAEGATYFVTFRLADSLPQAVVNAYRDERDRLLAAFQENSPHLTKGDAIRLHELFEEKVERYLDAGLGECWMRRPAIADLVQNALLFFHGDRYFLHAWAVMPNHVHAVVQPAQTIELPDILHSWKSFTAKEANKVLERSGPFWQSEPWDHLVRDGADLAGCVTYTFENPMEARLKSWKWFGKNLLA